MSISAKEIAKRLKISEATVSLALNNKSGVGTPLKKKILDFAKENGYDFTRINSRNGFNGRIAFVYYRKSGAIVDDTPFFRQLIEGINSSASTNEFSIVQYFTNEDNLEKELSYIKSTDCIGMLVLGTEMQKNELQILANCELPAVVMDTYCDEVNLNYVNINNMQGAFLATSYLIKKLHAQPGYLASSYRVENFEERAEGFYQAIRLSGLSSRNSIKNYLSPTIDGAYADMKEIIKNEQLASCYFADNDLIAIGALKALKEEKLSVPKKVSIIGFDDISLCTQIEPNLTTINVPKEDIGRIAINRLLEITKNNDNSKIKISISTSLVERDTVKK